LTARQAESDTDMMVVYHLCLQVARIPWSKPREGYTIGKAVVRGFHRYLV
jgi:hypothetical protein